MRWETEWSFDGKLCQEYSHQKLSKSDNWFSSYSQKCLECFFETQCISADLADTAVVSTLNNAEAIHISTVLEDCIDQLIILGHIMPVPFQKRPDTEQVCLKCLSV